MALTKWHKLQNAFARGDVSLEGMQEFALSMPDEAWKYLQSVIKIDGKEVETLFKLVEGLPIYYIDRELIDMLGREDVRESLKAMHRAGVDNLPYPALLIEFEATVRDNVGSGRNFVLLSERTTPRMGEEDGYHPYRANLFRYIEYPELKLRRALMSPQTMYARLDENADAGDGLTAFGIHYLSLPAPYVKPSDELMSVIDTAHARVTQSVSDGLLSAILLLNTRGVKKELIIPNRKANKERKKYRKPMIPEYTVVRVGHVYDKQGNAHAVGAGKSGRKPMRVHWRRGHTRMVWTGPRDGERKQKLVYINPCLVNFEGEMPTTPVQKVKW